VRVDFVISGIPALKANQVTITYGSGSMTGTVPLTDGPNGTITGYFGPQTGFQVGPGYNQMTPLQVSLSNNAPGGTLTVVGNVDDLSTTPPTSLAMQSSMITVPALTYTQMPPTMITAGSATAAMGTATLNDPGNGPSYSNVRVDFVLSGIPGLKAAQVHITYPTTGPSSTGNIPLTDGPNGTITGYFGPQTGFPVSPPYDTTTNLSTKIDSGAPGGTLTIAGAVGDVSGTTRTDTISSATNTVTVVGAPGAPTGVSAAPRSQALVVSFSSPMSTGGAAISGYTVTATPSSGPPVTASGTSSPITVMGLTNGVTYTVTVHATNSTGSGPESASTTGTPTATSPGPVPGTPGAPTVVIGDGDALVSFTPAPTNGQVVTYTVIARPTNGGAAAFVSGPASPIKVTGLIDGVPYVFTVIASSSGGTSPASAGTTATPAARPVVTITAPKTVVAGKSLVVTGSVSRRGGTTAGTPVLVTDTDAATKGVRTVGTAVVRADGSWSLTVRAVRAATFSGTVISTGADGAFTAAKTATKTVVKAVVVLSTARRSGTRVVVTGFVAAAQSGRQKASLVILNSKGTIVKVLKTVTLSGSSTKGGYPDKVQKFSFTKTLPAGSYRIAVRFSGSSQLAGATSRSLRERV